jgi:hypothetical protein
MKGATPVKLIKAVMLGQKIKKEDGKSLNLWVNSLKTHNI